MQKQSSPESDKTAAATMCSFDFWMSTQPVLPSKEADTVEWLARFNMFAPALTRKPDTRTHTCAASRPLPAAAPCRPARW